MKSCRALATLLFVADDRCDAVVAAVNQTAGVNRRHIVSCSSALRVDLDLAELSRQRRLATFAPR